MSTTLTTARTTAQVTREELEALGLSSLHRTVEDELNDEAAGKTTILIGCMDEVPVGFGMLNWAGPRDPASCAAAIGAPEIYRLTVLPSHQSGGVGSTMISDFEQMVKARGIEAISLGVAKANPRARQLYDRLGYSVCVETYYDEYQFADDTGKVHHIRDECEYMIKELC